jgi:hypothetical protein
MVHDLRLGEEFFSHLFAADAEIARRVAAAGCPWCGGPLHQAHYKRKPRGGAFAAAGEAFALRHSLCCGREGCRRRTLPPSLRFFGRRVYLEAVVLLAGAVVQLAAVTLRAMATATGVPGRTLRRWGMWWRNALPRSSTWVLLRARFRPPPPDEAQLPCSLVARLRRDLDGEHEVPTASRVCLAAARCLAPATTTSRVDISRFLGGLAGEHALI